MALRSAVYRSGPDRLLFLGSSDVLYFDTTNDGFIIGTTKPSASNTGAQGALSNYAGSFSPTPNTSTTPYRNLRITASMVDFPTTGTYYFENCSFEPNFSTTAARGVLGGNANANAHIILNNCTIAPQVSSNQLTGLYALNATVSRCNIYNVTDGFGSYGTLTLEANYVHDYNYTAASYQSDGVTHNDGFQVFGGTNHVVRGNFFDMRPGSLSDRPAPANSSTGGIGQSIALTPTRSVITNMLIEKNWIDYGFRGIGGAPSANPGGSILVQDNRFGPNIASFPVTGSGSKVRPICVDPALNLTGLPASGLGVLDTANRNVYEVDGSQILVYRQTP